MCYSVGVSDPFRLLNADEDAVVDSILQGMLDKELVKDEFKSDVGFNGAKKEPDPRVKMHMRHQQVTVLWISENKFFYSENFFSMYFSTYQ